VPPRSDVASVAPEQPDAALGRDADSPAIRADVAIAGDVAWVFIDGDVWTVDIAPAERARRARGGAGPEGLSAPMPATVVRILVEPGRDVKRGETLLLLEAMKMELPVRAPRDGRVKALHCRAGELVQPGVALVDLE
jgi:3-methylcrotonyl-CoA carboxylase alpha subunit